MFAKNLKELRQEYGLSQSELANAIGVSQGTIYFWENSINEPTIGFLVKLAQFFNISCDELLGVNNEHPINRNVNILKNYSKLTKQNKQLAESLIECVYQSQQGR